MLIQNQINLNRVIVDKFDMSIKSMEINQSRELKVCTRQVFDKSCLFSSLLSSKKCVRIN